MEKKRRGRPRKPEWTHRVCIKCGENKEKKFFKARCTDRLKDGTWVRYFSSTCKECSRVPGQVFINRTPRDPERQKIRWQTKWLIKQGKIHKKPCEICGDLKSETHHFDYNSPYNIKWLCNYHHHIEHRKDLSARTSMG